jgi:collagen type IV alpha-3-binding protein
VEKFHVVERVDDSTNITHMIHKRVWPSAQRESLLLSHLKQLNADSWVVQNCSVEHDKVPQTDKYVRMTVYVSLMAETYVRDGAQPPYNRGDFGCKVTYLAYVHPGGWAPPSVVA